MSEVQKATTPAALFTATPTIHFSSSHTACTLCEKPLKVNKTRTRTIATLAMGRIRVHETILRCNCRTDNTPYYSEELTRLVPHHGRFAYDVLVYVGLAMFIACKSDEQIMLELRSRGIPISLSEIAYLGKKFIIYLSIAHKQSTPQIRAQMRRQGGYILHLDGTVEADSPHLMSVLDGISQVVLDNIKLPSENTEQIIPFLQRIKNRFGSPIAIVHDMAKGIIAAVEKVFAGIPDYICHFHFLRDIGKDFFGGENDIVRKQLRRHGIQSFLHKDARILKKHAENNPERLEFFDQMLNSDSPIGLPTTEITAATPLYLIINWALAAKHCGDGYGFPFDRPHLSFYTRLRCVYDVIDALRDSFMNSRDAHARMMGKLWKRLGEAVNDPFIKKNVAVMEEKIAVFDRLRSAMRIALVDGPNALNDNGDTFMKSIRIQVTHFKTWLENTKQFPLDRTYQKFHAQIIKYWGKLFTEPICKSTRTGTITIYPQRTNNLMERLFRGVRRRNRKKTGTNSLTRALKAMLSDTPLVKNLENQSYLAILLAGASSLEERFAQIDAKLVREKLRAAESENRNLHPKVRKIIRIPGLPQKILDMIRSCHKSN